MPESAHIASNGVLTTKLNPPRIRSDILNRPRLLAHLARDTRRPLTLIAAPAGYGKSTLVALWLEQAENPVAWLSLDREDQDARAFLAHFVSAVRSCFSEACPDTLSLLGAPQLPRPATIAKYLSNDMEALPGHLTLVLDDFHHADTREVNEIVEGLLRHPPRLLHLVLITRRDPALSLTRLGALGCMVEVREQDLRFDQQETLAVIKKIAGIEVGPNALKHLHAELEGWIVGLRLVCLVLRDHEDPDAYLENLRGGTSRIQDYLTEEVISRQDPAFQQCLMKASILDCFRAPLCEAVFTVELESLPDTGVIADEAPALPKHGKQFLERLQKANLFCIGLDAHGDWFRFHHQFQHLLQRQLQRRVSERELSALHRAASKWFEDAGMTGEAIDHALSAGDVPLVTKMVERYRRAELDQDRWMGVEKWLNQLPDTIRDHSPELLLAQAWVDYFRLQTARIPRLVSLLEKLLKDHPQPDSFWLAELNFFRAVIFYWEGKGTESKSCCEQALALFGEKRGLLGGEVRIYLALARNLCGEAKVAIEAIEQDFRMDDAADFAFSTRMMAAKSFVHLLAGDLVPAGRAAARLVSIAGRWPSKYAVAWGLFPQALAAFHSHQLDEAGDCFLTVVEHRDFFEKRGVVDAYGGLMLAYQLMDRPEDVTRTVDELASFFVDQVDPECLSAEASLRARLALLQGDLKTAVTWSRSVETNTLDLGMFFWLEEPAITMARVLIAEGGTRSLQNAAELLVKLRSQAETRHLTCYLIDIMLLQAAALHAQNRPEKARAVLEHALEISRPGGWIRPFVELAPALSALLEQLHTEDSQAGFVQTIMASLKPGKSDKTRQESTPSALNPNASLKEALTNRELDVFELLANRLYDKEIAERLSVSPATVRTHLKNIYGKLGVGDRRKAVAEGRRLGVLGMVNPSGDRKRSG